MQGGARVPGCLGWPRRHRCRRGAYSPSASAAPPFRVEAVQQALADLTGIPRADQILMCEGARLDSAKPLSAYGLPWVSCRPAMGGLCGEPGGAALLLLRPSCTDGCCTPGQAQEGDDRVHDVFLYSRAHLRADAPLPPPEVLPDCPVDREY